jgi:hypothetical protein
VRTAPNAFEGSCLYARIRSTAPWYPTGRFPSPILGRRAAPAGGNTLCRGNSTPLIHTPPTGWSPRFYIAPMIGSRRPSHRVFRQCVRSVPDQPFDGPSRLGPSGMDSHPDPVTPLSALERHDWSQWRDRDSGGTRPERAEACRGRARRGTRGASEFPAVLSAARAWQSCAPAIGPLRAASPPQRASCRRLARPTLLEVIGILCPSGKWR